jgi:hypothetical protein
MLEAINHSKDMLQESIKSLSLLEQPDAVSAMTFAPEETFSQIKVLPDHMVLDMKAKQKQVVTFVNPLAHPRTELVSVLVNSEEVMVRGWVGVGGGALSGAGDAIHPVLKSHWFARLWVYSMHPVSKLKAKLSFQEDLSATL